MATKSTQHRTYLLRGGPFSGLRLTCQKHNRPGTVVLFSKRCCQEDIEDAETGDPYELDEKGVEYLYLEDDEDGTTDVL